MDGIGLYPAPPSRSPLSARAFGPELLLGELIGRGGMSRVYRGWVRGTGHEVAVKVLRDDLAARPEAVQRFVRERDLLAAVASRHVVRVHDLVVDGDELGIVMDLVPGGHLRKAVTFPCPPATAAELTAQIADGLAAVHATGVIHRDLKPENVLVDGDGQGGVCLRLTDFGISRLVDAALTQTTVTGTPGYLAPEVAAGRRPGAAADVYALGVVLYELCTGRGPFVADNPLVLILAHTRQEARRPIGMPDDLWNLLAATLAKDPSARPSAATVAQTLRALAPSLQGLAPCEPPEPEPVPGPVYDVPPPAPSIGPPGQQLPSYEAEPYDGVGYGETGYGDPGYGNRGHDRQGYDGPQQPQQGYDGPNYDGPNYDGQGYDGQGYGYSGQGYGGNPLPDGVQIMAPAGAGPGGHGGHGGPAALPGRPSTSELPLRRSVHHDADHDFDEDRGPAAIWSAMPPWGRLAASCAAIVLVALAAAGLRQAVTSSGSLVPEAEPSVVLSQPPPTTASPVGPAVSISAPPLQAPSAGPRTVVVEPSRRPQASPSTRGGPTPASPAPVVPPGAPTLARSVPSPAEAHSSDGHVILTVGGLTAGTGPGALASVIITYEDGKRQVPLTSPTATSYDVTVDGLDNGRRYTFSAMACNVGGRCTPSRPLTFTPYGAPVVPRPRASLTGGNVAVSWDAVDRNNNPGRTRCTIAVTGTPSDSSLPGPQDASPDGDRVTFTGRPGTSYVATLSCSTEEVPDGSASSSPVLVPSQPPTSSSSTSSSSSTTTSTTTTGAVRPGT